MSLSALGLVLCAAVLHSCWNLLAKAAHDSFAFLWLSLLGGALGFSPYLVVAAGRGELSGSAPWGLVAATSCVHAVYFFSLSQAYRHGDFSRVYPLSRGLGVALVPMIAFVTLGESIAPGGIAGVGLVVAGIIVASRSPRGARPASGGIDRGTAWALLTGACIGAYSTIDTAGARALDPVAYVTLLGFGACLVSAPLAWRRRAALAREWRAHRWRIAGAAAMSLSAYLLVLFALRTTRAGYVVAGRETSIVVGAALGTVVFREGQLKARLPGALVILAGVVCIALVG